MVNSEPVAAFLDKQLPTWRDRLSARTAIRPRFGS